MPNANTENDQPKRQRIEGQMHRSLPATLTIRALDEEGAEAGAEDGLLRLRLSVSSEAPYLRSSWFDEPWIEVLGHKAGEIDLERLNDGAPCLANHDRYTAIGNTPLAGIGVIEKAWTEGDKMLCDITISRREALEDLRQDITDNLVRNVSIGYLINERVLVKANGEGQPDEYRVTSWTPYEVSLVDIPADATVGIGRAADDQTQSPAPHYRVVDLMPAVGNNQGERSMPETKTPAANPTATEVTRAADIQVTEKDSLTVERERVREITAVGRQFGFGDAADQAVEAGQSVDAFRTLVLSKLKDSGQLRAAENPEIGMSENDVKQFSFARALLAASDPVNAAKLAPFEMECSRAAQDRRGDSRDKTREAAITIPLDVLTRGIAITSGIAASVQRMFAARGGMQRDLTVGAPTGGGNLVATELLGSSFIELLRNAMVLDKLGITWLRDLNGNVAIPSQTGAATGYWVTEGNAPTESQQTIGQVALTPKTVGGYTDYTRKLLLQSSLDVEAFIRADIASVIGLSMQAAAINGSGSGAEPTGLLNTSGIGSVAGGTNGAAPTYDHLVDLESAVGNANADVGTLAYLTNSKIRGKLRKTQEFASTNGKAVWTSGSERGIGEVLGYDAIVTNAMPSNLDKGTSTGVCSAIAYGNWADLIIGMWGGLDIMLDPYALATSGGRRVIALQDCDIAFRRVASFAAMKDALTA